jgi:hypothetical protein
MSISKQHPVPGVRHGLAWKAVWLIEDGMDSTQAIRCVGG